MRKTINFGQKKRLASLLLIPAVLAVDHALYAEDAPSNDLLLNLFVEKGYVSKQEADRVKQEAARRQEELGKIKDQSEKYKAELEQIKTEMARMQERADLYSTNQPGSLAESKWKIGKGVKSVELFGDARLRYENREATDPAGGFVHLDRYRYSLRFGLKGDLFDDVYYGFRLETGSNPRSPWNTFGSSGQTSPFGKSNAGVYVGQIYAGWKPGDWVEVTLGKMPNPLYTSTMVWSPNINVEGAAEKFKYTVGEADFFANFGQFLYQDTNPTKSSQGYFPLATKGSNPPFLLALQGGMDYHLTKDINFKVAPVLYLYTEYNNANLSEVQQGGTAYSPDYSGTYVGQGSTVGVQGQSAYYNLGSGFDGYYANQTGINNLMVLEVPFEMNWKMSKLNLRLFGDFAQNLQGKDRAQAAYDAANSYYFSASGPGQGLLQPINSPQRNDTRAYQIGFGIGSTNLVYGPMQGLVYGNSSKKNAWEFRTYWQHIEQYSLDPNLLDTDFFDGRENMEGLYAAFAYGFCDNVIGTVRYGLAHRINNQLGTGGTGGDVPQMNPVNDYSIFQFDIGVRF